MAADDITFVLPDLAPGAIRELRNPTTPRRTTTTDAPGGQPALLPPRGEPVTRRRAAQWRHERMVP